MISKNEAECYIRLTLKEWNVPDIQIEWIKTERTLGRFWGKKWKIDLSQRILNSSALFREVFLHELAHALDYRARGNTFMVNGRLAAHNKSWKAWCRRLGIRPRRLIPTNEILLMAYVDQLTKV